MTIKHPMFPPLAPAASPASRRTILFGLAAAAAAAPAMASPLLGAVIAPATETPLSGLAPGLAESSEIDPIFAAIKAERNAYARYCASKEYYHTVAKELDPVCERRHGTPAWEAYKTIEAAHTEIDGEWYDAQMDFLETQPTTASGLIAYFDHIDAHCDPDEGWDAEWRNQAFPTITAAVRTLIGGARWVARGSS
jgi:hypothetical protein